MVGSVPMFLDQRGLRALAGWMIEAVRNPIIERLDRIMVNVTIDSDALASLTTLAQTVDTEVKALIQAGTLAPGDVSGITAALNDANTALTAASTATGTPPVTVGDGSTDPGTGASTGTTGDPAAPADPTTTDGTGTPVDPATGAPTA